MKKTIALLMALYAMAGGMYADKFTSHDRMAMTGVFHRGNKAPASRQSHYIVELTSADCVSALEDAGAAIVMSDGALAVVATDHAAAIEALDCVRSMALSGTSSPLTCFAREDNGIDGVHGGETMADLGPLDGTGVITGIFDGGIDPNHINFLDSDGENRIKKIWHYTDKTAECREYIGEEISQFKTDNANMSHGTHVLGIMAGSWKGETVYGVAETKDGGSARVCNGPNPFYGVAPGSEMIVCCGELEDVNVIDGIKKMRDYASEAGKPLVVNLSIGKDNGPHDGSTPFGRYLTELGKQVPLVLAAGNSGGATNTLSHTCHNGSSLSTFLTLPESGMTYKDNDVEFEIWGSDERPFQVELDITDIRKDSLIATIPLMIPEGMSRYAYTATNFDDLILEGWDKEACPYLDKCFYKGFAAIEGSVNDANGRYNTTVSLRLDSKRGTVPGTIVTLRVKGPEGYRIDLDMTDWSSGEHRLRMESRGLCGYLDGSDIMAVSENACSQGVLTVGSYNSRANYGRAGGTAAPYTLPGLTDEGDVSYFSSCATLVDGRCVPDVIAPGAGIVSSVSTPHMASIYKNHDDVAAFAAVGQTEYMFDRMEGTSMAAPFASGVVAIWLQSKPDLTSAEIIEIARQTATIDKEAEACELLRWGNGKIDVAAGLRLIMVKTGVKYLCGENLPDMEVGRCNLQGIPVDETCTGPVIIQYADGSARKCIAR